MGGIWRGEADLNRISGDVGADRGREVALINWADLPERCCGNPVLLSLGLRDLKHDSAAVVPGSDAVPGGQPKGEEDLLTAVHNLGNGHSGSGNEPEHIEAGPLLPWGTAHWLLNLD